VARPNDDLGRAGPVCPFVPPALERKTLWLAPEQIADRSAPEVVQRMDEYRRLFLHLQPTDGDDLDYKAIVVVFTDVPADRARAAMDEVHQHWPPTAYPEDGMTLRDFYEGNEDTAIHNASFRPFTSPVPFILIRHAVLRDWKLFLDNDRLLDKWARRFGKTAVQALAEELRRTNWKQLES
jgi:hypothetical protein